MEFIHCGLCMDEILSRFPSVVVGSKSFPRDQVFQPIAFDPRVKNALNFPFLSVTALDRGRRRLAASWNGVWLVRLEKTNMEDIVDFH